MRKVIYLFNDTKYNAISLNTFVGLELKWWLYKNYTLQNT